MALRLLSKTYWNGSQIKFRTPVDATCEATKLNAADGADIRGFYWTPKNNPRPKVVVVASHTRVDFSHHHVFPALLEAGYGCLGANLRSVTNDTDCIHERLVLDIAAHIRWLKEHRGVEKVILLGNSGGGSLYSFYQSQATAAPKDRIHKTPGGRPTGLPEADLPSGDLMIFMAAHAGQGLIINETIDPSVLDEHNPLLTDSTLDMYDPCNGFRAPPEWTKYSSEFVQRYRDAQIERVRRLDAVARSLIADSAAAEALHADLDFQKLTPNVQREILRREAFEPIMVIYRTMANLHYADNSLDPSNRSYGSLLSDRPDLMNFQQRGFARIQTPHAWLSTWSGISSNANVTLTAPKLNIPTLVIHADRDLDVFPQTHTQLIYDAIGTEDKELWTFPDALHYFEPEDDGTDRGQLELLVAKLVPWLQQRAPL